MAGKRWLIISVFLLGMGCTAAARQIIYVDADASGVNNGSSWTDAYNYLQDALADANSGDEIWVAEGIYKPDEGAGITPGDRTATFQLINDVAIRGGYAGFGEPDPNARDIDKYETILSGDLAGNDVEVDDPRDLLLHPSRVDNVAHVVTGSGTDGTAILDGFTVTGGHFYAVPGFSSTPWGGGGMYNDSGSPTVMNCTFSENCNVGEGGGMYNYNNSNPTVSNCTFIRNWGSAGGGMCNFKNSSPFLTNCTFRGNAAESLGGGIHNESNSNPTLTNCTFICNEASNGAGLFNYRASPTLMNCTLSENSAIRHGGGVGNSKSTPILKTCIFVGNTAARGADMYNSYESSLMLTNCTFAENSAPNGNALACDSDEQNYPSSVHITNCIFWNGGNQIWNNDGSTITIGYSDVQGGQTDVYDPCDGLVWGEGNIDADPGFVSSGYWADINDPNIVVEPNDPNAIWIDGDYHLKSQAGRWEPSSQSWVKDDVTSPCIDGGDMASPIGYEPFPNGGIINMGAYGGMAEGSKSYFGEPVCETIIAGDINGDCKVNFLDFRIMAFHWLEER